MRKWIRPNPGKVGGTAPPSISTISAARARLLIQREVRRAGRIRDSREDERLSYSQQALLAVPVSANCGLPVPALQSSAWSGRAPASPLGGSSAQRGGASMRREQDDALRR